MLDPLTSLEQIARLAELHCRREETLLTFAFDMGEGRRQTVAVTHLSRADDGTHVVLFFSPCQRVTRNLLVDGLARDHALTLLRHNANLSFGHFALMDFEGEEMVCVRATHLLETMDVAEFQALCHGVAMAADAWEEHHGLDQF